MTGSEAEAELRRQALADPEERHSTAFSRPRDYFGSLHVPVATEPSSLQRASGVRLRMGTPTLVSTAERNIGLEYGLGGRPRAQ